MTSKHDAKMVTGVGMDGRKASRIPVAARWLLRATALAAFSAGTAFVVAGMLHGVASAHEIPTGTVSQDIPLSDVSTPPVPIEYVPTGTVPAPNDEEGLAEFAPEAEERHESVDGREWGFWLYRARPGATRRPLILSLHGSGECGGDLSALRVSSLSRFVLDGTATPDCDILMPQCPSFGWDTEGLRSLLLHVADELGTDMGRISVTGMSMGGFGTWDLLSAYPDLFFAAAPVASSGTNGGEGDLSSCTARIRSLVGTADGYDAAGTVAIVNSGGGDAEQIWVPGAGHSEMCAVYGMGEYDPVPFLLGEEE